MPDENDVGATPGADDTGQGGQPADTNNGNQGEDAILKNFYQLPDDVRNVLGALPEETRNQVVKAIDDHRISQETGFNDRLTRGREAEVNLTQLLNDPNIVSYLQTGNLPNKQQANDQLNQQNSSSDQRDFSKYGDGAKDFVDDLVAQVMDQITPALAGVQTEVQGIKSVFNQNQANSQWGNLEIWAKENNLPDPNNYASTIGMVIKQNPNLTVDQAYRVALDSKDLVNLRTPVNQPNKPNTQDQTGGTNQKTKQPVNNLPGGNTGSGSPRSVTEDGNEGLDAGDIALKARLEGKVTSLADSIKAGFAKAIGKYNEEHGTSLTENDL